MRWLRLPSGPGGKRERKGPRREEPHWRHAVTCHRGPASWPLWPTNQTTRRGPVATQPRFFGDTTAPVRLTFPLCSTHPADPPSHPPPTPEGEGPTLTPSMDRPLATVCVLLAARQKGRVASVVPPLCYSFYNPPSLPNQSGCRLPVFSESADHTSLFFFLVCCFSVSFLLFHLFISRPDFFFCCCCRCVTVRSAGYSSANRTLARRIGVEVNHWQTWKTIEKQSTCAPK